MKPRGKMDIEKVSLSVQEITKYAGKKNITCPQPNCDKVLAQAGALYMHLTKVHRILENERSLRLFSGSNSNKIYQYYCPVEGCKYNIKLGRFFRTPTALKQHYFKVHGEKRFTCNVCGLGFGLESDQVRHSAKCDMTFLCSDCGDTFKHKLLLYEHCNQLGHRYNFDPPREISCKLNNGTEKQTPAYAITTAEPRKLPVVTNNNKTSDALSNTSKIIVVKRACEFNDNTIKSELVKCVGNVATTVKPIEPNTVKNIGLSNDQIQNTSKNIGSYHEAEKNTSPLHKFLIKPANFLATFPNCNVKPSVKSDPINQSLNIDTSSQVSIVTKDISKSVSVSEKHKEDSISSITNQSSSYNYMTENGNIADKSDKNIIKLDHIKDGNAPQFSTLAGAQSEPVGVKTSTDQNLLKPQMSDNEQNYSLVCSSTTGGNVIGRKILPKTPNSSFVVIPPNYKGNIIFNTSSYFVTKDPTQKPIFQYKAIQPKVCMPSNTRQPKVVELKLNTKDAEVSATLPYNELKIQATIQKGVQTQTSQNCILQKAMRSAKLPIVKESRGSQVSPRAKLKRPRTSTTQTQSPKARRRRRNTAGRDSAVNTDIPTMKPSKSKPNILCHDVCVQEIQTETESVGALPSVEDMARIVESISTQTAESYLANAAEVHGLGRHSQTHLHMDMTLKDCNTMDVHGLEQMGIALPQQPPIATQTQSMFTSQASCSKSQFASPLPSTSSLARYAVPTTPVHTLPTRHSKSMGTSPNPKMTTQSNTLYDKHSIGVDCLVKDPLLVDNTAESSITDELTQPHSLRDASVQGNTMSLLGQAGISHGTQSDLGIQTLFPNDAQTDVSDLPSSTNHLHKETGNDGAAFLHEVLTHMETQTTDDIFPELILNETETQTIESGIEIGDLDFLEVHAGTQTSGMGITDSPGTSRQHVEIQASLTNVDMPAFDIVQSNMETQTLFDEMLTDSQTQTSLNDFISFVKQLQ